jgi:hypothetical protein
LYDKFGVNRFVGARLRRRGTGKCTKENLGIDRRISGDDDAISDDRKWSLRRGPVFSWAKTKKPAAGGGAAGFLKTEQRLGGGVPLFRQTSLGRRSGPSEFEALREEVHRFDETKIPNPSAY